MKTPLAFVLLLLSAAFAGAAAIDEIITATVTVTNAPMGNTNTLTVNASVRTFTNSISASPSTLIQETNSVYYTATNILNHLSLYPQSPGHNLSQSTASNVVIRGISGKALVVSLAGLWGTVTYSTNNSTNAWAVRVPMGIEPAALRTNIGSGLVEYANLATNSINSNATALANFLTKGASPSQTIIGPVRFYNVGGTNSGLTNGYLVNVYVIGVSNLSGFIGALTNGILTNAIFLSPKSTNGVNYGNAFSSPGAGSASEQFGLDAIASGIGSAAFGAQSEASGDFSLAFGQAAQATVEGAMALGNNAAASGVNAIVIGPSSSASAEQAMSIGYGVVNSTAFRIVIGGTGHTIAMGGLFDSPVQTNSVFKGTNTFNGRLDLTPRSNAGFTDGYNAAKILGTNVYVRISGPAGAYTNAGFSAAAATEGTYHIIEADNPGLSFVLINKSGLDAAENQFDWGQPTGFEKRSTNNPVVFQVIYNKVAQKWRVMGFPPN